MFAELAVGVCTLAGVPVDGCDPRAAAYAEIVADIPPEHWLRVPLVRIEVRSGGRTDRDTLTVTLPARLSRMAAYHEVGHVLAATTPGALENWRAAFWPRRAPVGTLPVYARQLWQRTADADLASREDLADSYAYTLKRHDGLDQARRAWITAWWPAVAL